jgi:hypothetical protein
MGLNRMKTMILLKLNGNITKIKKGTQMNEIIKDKDTKTEGFKDDLVDLQGLAKFLGRTNVTIWRYRRKYNLPEYHAGKTILFRISEVLEAIRVK